MLWIDTQTDQDAERVNSAIWDSQLSITEEGTILAKAPGPEEAPGEFWYDALQQVKDDARRRYDIARRHLPLPAAWREMAIALRAMIRSARKSGDRFEAYLGELHHLAAVWSFSDPARSGRGGAGYRIMEFTPYGRIAALDLSWQKIGCNELALLNKSDVKLMVETWGEPSNHIRACDLYRAEFEHELARIDRGRDKRIQEAVARSLRQYAALTEPPSVRQLNHEPAPLWQRFLSFLR